MPPEVKQGILPPFNIKKFDYKNFVLLVISEFFIGKKDGQTPWFCLHWWNPQHSFPHRRNGSGMQMEKELEGRSPHDNSDVLMMSLIQRYTSKHPEVTLNSRWIPGFPQHGEGHGATVTPPNQATEEKIRRFRKERTSKRISLDRTAGRSRQFECRYWSPRPERQKAKLNRKQYYHPIVWDLTPLISSSSSI